MIILEEHPIIPEIHQLIQKLFRQNVYIAT